MGRVVKIVTRRHPPPEIITGIALYNTSLGIAPGGTRAGMTCS
jgi:hypothetical protein